MKLFSDLKGQPRPDLSKPISKGDSSNIADDDKTNRTCPNKLKEPKPFKVKSSKIPARKGYSNVIFNSDDWLFTQATAVCSVVTEEDGYTIKPSSAPYVNDNANAFRSELLAETYKSFIGAHNYIDHIQEPSKSKGIIIDAVKRAFKTEDGDIIYYIDTLIATNKKADPKWCSLIESGEVKYLSMGCTHSALRCSKCGHTSFDDEDMCEHMVFELGYSYLDDSGAKHPIAALVENDDDPETGEKGGLIFEELSYLTEDPAFAGAIKGHLIETQPNTELVFEIPYKLLARSAFQTWQPYLKGVPVLEVIPEDQIDMAYFE